MSFHRRYFVEFPCFIYLDWIFILDYTYPDPEHTKSKVKLIYSFSFWTGTRRNIQSSCRSVAALVVWVAICLPWMLGNTYKWYFRLVVVIRSFELLLLTLWSGRDFKLNCPFKSAVVFSISRLMCAAVLSTSQCSKKRMLLCNVFWWFSVIKALAPYLLGQILNDES